MKSLRDQGFEVIAVAPRDEYVEEIEKEGFRFVHVPMEGTGSNPLTELMLIYKLKKAYKEINPDVILHYTIKPNTYGSIAANWLKIPVINNVSGLGTVFLKKGLVSTIAMWIYKYSFRYPKTVFFQNENDRKLFLDRSLVKENITALIPGSGINLDHFKPGNTPSEGKTFTFLLIARLLIDKGINEYIEAIKILKKEGVNARYQLLGSLANGHKRAIAEEKLNSWIDENTLEYLGTTNDVRNPINDADCIVLPSYREGTPRTLLEAASMGKPIVATDVPGCNSVVQDEVNGFLCNLKDGEDLARKMKRMAELDRGEIRTLGANSRMIAEEKFDEKIVFDQYSQYIKKITNQQK